MNPDETYPAGQRRAWSTVALRDYQEFLNEMERLFKSGDPLVASPAVLEIYTQQKENAGV